MVARARTPGVSAAARKAIELPWQMPRMNSCSGSTSSRCRQVAQRRLQVLELVARVLPAPGLSAALATVATVIGERDESVLGEPAGVLCRGLLLLVGHRPDDRDRGCATANLRRVEVAHQHLAGGLEAYFLHRRSC
jgi:hypothetical protein